MLIYKQFSSNTDARRLGYRNGQTIPARLEDKSSTVHCPLWLRFKHGRKQHKLKLDGASNRRQAEKMAREEYGRIVHVNSKYRHWQGDIPFIFPNPKTGKPFGHASREYERFFPQSPRKAWEIIAKRANLTDRLATPYTFRRTAGTILAKDLGLQGAAEILDHSELSTTRCYVGVVSETHDRAAQVLETSIRRANDARK